MHYSKFYALFSAVLDKSAFSTYSFGKLAFRFFVFSACPVFLFHLRNFRKVISLFLWVSATL